MLPKLDALLRDTFATHGLAVGSIRCVATADLKRDEVAINLLAERLDVPVLHYNADDLNATPGPSGAFAIAAVF